MVSVRAALLLSLCAGCDYFTFFDTNPFSGDPFPILVETDSGAVVVGIRESSSRPMREAVLDVLSPITIVDLGADVEPEFNDRTFTLYGARAPGEPLDQPRARLDARVATLHPCLRDTPICEVGTPAAPRSFDAIIGLDAFSSDSLRLRLDTHEMFIFPDIAGDSTRRAEACDVVMPAPFRGGGTLILGGAEVSFPNRRIAIDTCLAPNPDPREQMPQRDRGVDALLVVSTAIGTSMINEATYTRYREVFATEPALDALPEETILLPSGPVTGRMTTIPAIALVGNLSSVPRAPCRGVYASHLFERGSCLPGVDCPCPDGKLFCSAPSVIELAPPARIPVLVVPNDNPTLQALRTELRPDRPEVDGLLGTSALAGLELDIDIPHDRLLGRCVDTANCGARVQLAEDEPKARDYLRTCLGDERGPFP